jgi:hypothetical protein
MSMRTLETAILAELRVVAGRRSIRLKDIMEWSTGDVKILEGDTHFFLPGLEINVAVSTEALGEKMHKKEPQNA